MSNPSPEKNEHPAWLSWGLAACCLTHLLLSTSLAWGPLGRSPHVSDEIAYTLQARLFASGMRVGPAPEDPSLVLYPFWQAGAESYAVFPPGWPLILSIGERLELAWLVNPLLGSALPLLVGLLARRWCSPAASLLAAALTALSPGVLLLSASRMAHSLSLVSAGLCWLAALHPGRVWALVGGGALGLLALTRPFDAVLTALLTLPLLSCTARPRGELLLAAAITSLGGCLMLADNAALTGHPLTFPVQPWWDAWVADQGLAPGCNRLGWGSDRGCAPSLGSLGHTPDKALWLTLERLKLWDRNLLGLPGGGLLVLWGLWRARSRWLVAALSLPVAAYSLYWSPGLAYGARFYSLTLLIAPVAVARGVGGLQRPRRWGWGLLGAPLLGFSPLSQSLAQDYWCVGSDLSGALEEAGVEEGLLWVRLPPGESRSWEGGLDTELQCDPLLRSGEAFALWDPSSLKAGLQVRHYLEKDPHREAFLRLAGPFAGEWLFTQEAAGEALTLWRRHASGEWVLVWSGAP